MDMISVLTLRLAEAIGLYMIMIGMGGLFAPQRWRALLKVGFWSLRFTRVRAIVSIVPGILLPSRA